MLQNEVRDKHAVCQIVAYLWKTEALPQNVSDDELSDSTPVDISRHLVQSCTFSKNIGSPSGAFNFKLDNSRNWNEIIKPGQWCLIFMDNDGVLRLPEENFPTLPAPATIVPSKLRGMCYIERVSLVSAITENGVLESHFEVSGRDYGVCYEQTEIWFNGFEMDQTLISTLNTQIGLPEKRTLDALIREAHSLFFSAEKRFKSQDPAAQALKKVATQWMLPRQMTKHLGIELDGAPLLGNFKNLLNMGKTLCRMPVTDVLSFLNGVAWEKLKGFALAPEFHELFTELDENGQPKLVFRAIPWGISSTGYPDIRSTVGETLMYLGLIKAERIDITAQDVIEFVTGLDDHNRYNHFFTTASAGSQLEPESNISVLKGKVSLTGHTYPSPQTGSIKRHGLRKMHLDVNSFSLAEEFGGEKKGGRPKTPTLVQFNELVLDYWNNAIFFETGDMKIIGNNNIRVGKPIVMNGVPFLDQKAFYIEEYTDEFIIEDNGATSWTQTLQLTRGASLSALQAASGFNRINTASDENSDFVGDK